MKVAGCSQKGQDPSWVHGLGGEAGGGREQPQPGDRAGLGMRMGTGMGTGTRSLHWLSSHFPGGLEMMALPLQNGNSPLQKELMTPNFLEQLKNVINSNY